MKIGRLRIGLEQRKNSKRRTGVLRRIFRDRRMRGERRWVSDRRSEDAFVMEALRTGRPRRLCPDHRDGPDRRLFADRRTDTARRQHRGNGYLCLVH